MSACPTDPPPATRAASPTSLAALADLAPAFGARTTLPNACAPLAAYHGADPDPPPAARLAHYSCLRI
jgi:hypothetical protein